MPGKRLTPSIIQKIITFSTILVKRDGTPNQLAIAKRVKRSPASVKRALEGYYPSTPNITPDPKKVEEANNNLWRQTKREVYPSMAESMRNLASRLQSSSGDPDYDARDLRHLSAAVDTAFKTLSLASGDVTSRTQQQQQVEHTVKHEVIQVPAKESAAFLTEQGVKGELPAAYDVDKDE